MHTCPDCGQACSCSGDFEDHDTGDEFECVHCDGSFEDKSAFDGLTPWGGAPFNPGGL
jgi:hypothetical protein